MRKNLIEVGSMSGHDGALNRPAGLSPRVTGFGTERSAGATELTRKLLSPAGMSQQQGVAEAIGHFREPECATDEVLVVDLDGTLTRSDLLFETLWSAVSKGRFDPFAVVRSLLDGRAALKRTLAEQGPIEVAQLPYNDTVLEYVRRWRAAGGKTALVTASDQRLAETIADHLGLFDEVHGASGGRNLKGGAKAAFLANRFGRNQFTYVGDSEADLDVWRIAKAAVTVDLPKGRRGRVDATVEDTRHLITRGSNVPALVRALRPHQWLKNLLIFLPMLAAHQFDGVTFGRVIPAFVAFCLIASSVYLLNDLLDLEADRQHPRKRNRPFANGALPLWVGSILAPGLLVAGLVISLLLGPAFLIVMLVYYLITTAYSFKLKRLLIIDICTLAGLYTLRIVAGGVAPSIPLSLWLLAFSILFFFSLAAMKRQAELISGVSAGETTAHGRRYQVNDLPLISTMAVSSGYVAILVLALYLQSDAVQLLYGNPVPLWGICLVLFYWISRMVMITHRGLMHDDPVVFAARDPISLICVALVFALAVAGVLI